MSYSAVQTNGHSPPRPSWQAVSVGEFFSTFPWIPGTDAKKSHSPQPGSTAAPGQLDMSCSVREFFSHFAWEGTPKVAQTIDTLELQAPPLATEDTLTLDGFADMF